MGVAALMAEVKTRAREYVARREAELARAARARAEAAESAARERRAAREPCRDLKPHCDFWASGGECPRNPGYMNQFCPVACGACGVRADPRKRCHDLFPDWSVEGDARRADPQAYLDGVFSRARVPPAIRDFQSAAPTPRPASASIPRSSSESASS